MLIVRSDSDWHTRIRKDGESLVGLWSNGAALDVLLSPVTNVNRRVAECTKKLCFWVFVEHAFTERAELLPFETTVLREVVQQHAR